MLLYRSVWNEDHPDVALVLRSVIVSWLQQEGFEATIPDRGIVDHRGMTVEAQRADTEFGQVVRYAVNHSTPEGTEATTIGTAITGGANCLWVEAHGNDSQDLAPIATTRLVHKLLRAGDRPNRSGHRLTGEAIRLYSHKIEETARLITAPPKDVAILVVGEGDWLTLDSTEQIARATAERVSGLCQVIRVDQTCIDELDQHLVPDLRVRPGSARLVLVTPGSESPTSFSVMSADLSADVGALGEWAFEKLVRWQPQPSPKGWAGLGLLLESKGAEKVASSVAAAADLEAIEKLYEGELAELHRRLNASLTEIDQLNESFERVVAERDTYREALLDSRRPPRETEMNDASTGSLELPSDLLPSEAIEWARTTLQHVEVHERAVCEVERVDCAPSAAKWGRDTGRALVALDSYAQAAGRGESSGFFHWCSDTGAWGTDRLAMTESESVQNNERLLRRRFLPVSEAVSASGHMTMLAHMKIVKGGPANIPRLYFHDDTAGSTGKMHVGFFGPHDLMPNTQ
jgi:hypothetical protein